MKTTHQKFHPTATPPDGAVYIGSIEAPWKCDLYLSGDDVHQLLSPTERARHRVKCIQDAAESGDEWYIAASSLILAYREKQATPTAPTLDFQRFTDRARRVMAMANEEARRFNHETVAPYHILLGLVKDPSCVGVKILNGLDIDPRKVRLEVEKLIKSGPDMVTIGKLPLSHEAKTMVACAGEESTSLNHKYIGTEHLLISAIRDEGYAGAALRVTGLTVEEVRSKVLAFLGQSTPTPTPMTREGIIETLARAGYDYLRDAGAFDKLPVQGRENILRAAEAQAIAIGAVKPAPEPEPVRSDGEKIAAAMIRSRGRLIQFSFADGAFGCEYTLDREVDVAMRSFRAVVAKTIDDTLDTRDRQHAETLRKELEALRDAHIKALGQLGLYSLQHVIRAVPLTIAERSTK